MAYILCNDVNVNVSIITDGKNICCIADICSYHYSGYKIYWNTEEKAMKIIDLMLETLRTYLSCVVVLSIVTSTRYNGWSHVMAFILCFLVVGVKRFFKSAWSDI